MYSINGRTISITNGYKGRTKFNLTASWCYRTNGNLQIILDRDKRRIEIHKLIDCKCKNYKGEKDVGIDKGYTKAVSCSDGNEYGDLGPLLTEETYRLDEWDNERNYFIQKAKNIRQKIKELEEENSDKNKEEIKHLQKQLNHIEKHHLGNKLYNRQHSRAKETIENRLNHSLNQMFEESKPTKIIKESLKFARNSNKGKKYNRKMSSWNKGVLDKRIDFKSTERNIKTVEVNPAYTSQYCSTCGSKIIKRYGEHHEFCDCPICGKLNANTNAAVNILNRDNDKEITLYTPYKKVKEILDRRITEQIA